MPVQAIQQQPHKVNLVLIQIYQKETERKGNGELTCSSRISAYARRCSSFFLHASCAEDDPNSSAFFLGLDRLQTKKLELFEVSRMVWYGMVWYGMVWTEWYAMVWHGLDRHLNPIVIPAVNLFYMYSRPYIPKE